MKKTISVRDLNYQILPSVMADDLESAKAGFLGGGDKKRFLKCIREGKAELAEVIVSHQLLHTDYHDNSYNTYHYGVILTTDGIPVCETVLMHGAVSFYTAAEMDDYYDEEEDSPEYIAEIEAQKRKPKKRGFVLHYYLGKKECFMLLDEKLSKNLAAAIKDILPLVDCLMERA